MLTTPNPITTYGEMKTYEKDTPYGSLACYIHSLEDKDCIASNPELEEEIANLLIDIRQKHLQESDCLYDNSVLESDRKRRKVSETEDSDMDYKEMDEIVQPYEEDYWVETDHDDDWKDSKNTQNMLVSPMISPKHPRKKAPSGTACEKHKRWKKRCPEDCPMRKQKSKKLSPTLSRKAKYSEDSNSDQEEIAEDRTMYNRRKRTIENMGDAIESDDLSVDRNVSIKRRNGGRRPFGATIACERHTTMHARCPPNCPDRRPSGASRAKKSRESDDSDYESISDLSPVNSNNENFEEFEDNKEDNFFQSEMSLNPFARFNDELPKSTRIQMKALSSELKLDTNTNNTNTNIQKKSPKTPRNKGARKYLPQACERHKLLHAKCPANCPDRMRRDSEKKYSISTPTSPISSTQSPSQQVVTVTLIAQH